jgi:hypothetical protein
MRITNWKKFNESVNEEFTEEMAQEIIYSFSEDSDLSGELDDLVRSFDASLKNENINGEAHFGMYETGYDEMKEMIKKLYGFVQTGSLSFKDDMINLYHEIRKVKAKFPEVYEIEDLFLTFIESNNFEFHLDYMKPYGTSSMIYQIRLGSQWNGYHSMEEFHKFCDVVTNLVKRFSHPSCRMYVQQCKYYYYDGRDQASVDFDIIIK